MGKTVMMIGAFDTKGRDYAFLREEILSRGHAVFSVNTGVLGTTDLFPVDVEAAEVAEAGGGDLDSLRRNQDRGEAMKIMAEGAPVIAQRYLEQSKYDGIIGMGGSGGTSVISAAMRALPVGFP